MLDRLMRSENLWAKCYLKNNNKKFELIYKIWSYYEKDYANYLSLSVSLYE